MSDGTIALKVGTPADPAGDANTSAAVCDNNAVDNVPVVVTGVLALKIVAGIDKPTLVTVPDPPEGVHAKLPNPSFVKAPEALAGTVLPLIRSTVAAAVTLVDPLNVGLVQTTSPVNAIVRPVCNAVAVAAFPVIVVWSPVFVPDKLDPEMAPEAATLVGVMAPSDKVMAGVVVPI